MSYNLRKESCRFFKSGTSLLSAAACLAFSGMAEAQSASPQEAVGEAGLGDIIVTAQRRTQRLQDVPASVSVVGGAALESRNIRSLTDLSAQLPAVKISLSSSNDALHIRGVGSGFNAGFEQSVAIFVDGVYRSRSRLARVSLFDIDRVEVLKGPQTTFFGANAIAGALNITTRKAGDKLEANASALYAFPDGEYSVQAGLSVPVTENWSVRVAGLASGMTKGYIHRDAFGDLGPDLKNRQLRASSHFESGALTIDAKYDFARIRDHNAFDGEFVACPPPAVIPAPLGLCAQALARGPLDDRLDRHSAILFDTRSFLDFDELSGTIRYDLGPVSLIATTAYFDLGSQVAVESAPLPGPSPIGTPYYLATEILEKSDQFSQELRLQSEGTGPLQYMAGVYYDKSNIDISTPTATGFPSATFVNLLRANGINPNNFYTKNRLIQQTKTVSGFGSVTFNAGDHLGFTGSLRYTRVEKDAERETINGTGGRFGIPGPFVRTGNPVLEQQLGALRGQVFGQFPRAARVDDAWMPGASIRYKFNNDAMVYASYTRGFKAGGYAQGSTINDFEPEYVDAYEVGFKASWFDRRLTTNIALFQSDYSDLQETTNITTQQGTTLSLVTNAAKSRSRGVEMELRARVAEGFELGADVAYVESYYLEYSNRPCSTADFFRQGLPLTAFCIVDAAGDPRAFAPKWSGSITADYRTPIGNDLRLGVGATLAFTSSYFFTGTLDPALRQAGYAKLDARVTLGRPDGRWELAIMGRNLTDKQTANMGSPAAGAPGSVFKVADRPRSVAFQVSYRY